MVGDVEKRQQHAERPTEEPCPGTVVILFPSGHLELHATVKALALGLAQAGWPVEVYTARNRFSPPPRLSHPLIRLRVLPWMQKRFRERAAWLTIAFAFWALKRSVFGGRPAFLVGAGLRGLWAATVASLCARRPVVYHCLELYPSAEQRSPRQRAYKALERWTNRRARLTIIQDPLRAELLARDNGIALQTVVTLPAAPPGVARRAPSNFLRQRFGLGKDQRVILYAGNLFAPYSLSQELVEAAQAWPANWTLVLHGNSTAAPPAELEGLRRADREKRVVFSLEPVGQEELHELVASADVGLALYKRADDNVFYLGLSSGKLAEYLRAGLPVVTSDFPGLRDLVEKYACGVSIADLSELEAAISRILTDAETISARSVEAFNRELAVENHLPRVIAALRERTARRPR